ncbi:hypothetical protein [Pseudogemmobacter bohemicus]|uniref:hypothetical protein n=1 Tax=Pseudogemmobacter bohemicus TaxID=2250708 RepID=UPI000DD2FBE0|nr:hypothetical protein [Pseudogemmobacter bohemicus]
MAAKPDLEGAQAFQDELRKAMANIPFPDAACVEQSIEYTERRTLALRALKSVIENNGGKVHEGWDGASIRIFGLRATSTSSLYQACRNWLNQLTVKSMGQNMKGPYT